MSKVSFFLLLLFSTFILPLICSAQKAQFIKTSNKIERYGSVIGLKPEFEERYIILHKHTFPGVLDRLFKSNIRNYSIFLQDGILFSHFEYVGLDFETDMAQMGDEVTKEWWKLTDPMQEPLESRQEGEWWTSLELLYEMNNSKVPYEKAQRSAFVATLNEDQKQNFIDRLNQTDQILMDLYLEYNVQNLTFYYHNNRIYFYSEYVGTDYKSDMNRLFQYEAMRKLDSDLNALLQPEADLEKTRSWQRMKEVFHTN